ncbi:MAG: hypothetical protein F4W90_04750 [Gammaproteobacteria bacterium]|nr:hypothetical protein [Gammaproteobacteria bacterium]
MLTVTAAAPGKLVLAGDYVVLLGAPALVLAVNRYALVALREEALGGWSIKSNVTSPANYASLDELLTSDQHDLITRILRQLPNLTQLPVHASLQLDSRTFYTPQGKLGLGSSAAILVAFAELIAHLTQNQLSDSDLIDVHNALQQNNGSGLDVLAARKGGLTRFQQRTAKHTALPSGVFMRFLFTGHSTRTAAMITKFHALRNTYPARKMNDWLDAATHTANAVSSKAAFFESMHELTRCALDFDDATDLGIYSEPHRLALKQAQRAKVIYKPCGAGGGDTGVVLSDDPAKLGFFEQNITKHGLEMLNLEMSSHGAIIQ